MKWWAAVPVATRQRKHVFFFTDSVSKSKSNTKYAQHIAVLSEQIIRQSTAKAKRNTHTRTQNFTRAYAKSKYCEQKVEYWQMQEIAARIFYTSTSSKKVTSHKSFASEKAHKSTNSCMTWPHFFNFFFSLCAHFSIECFYYFVCIYITFSVVLYVTIF